MLFVVGDTHGQYDLTNISNKTFKRVLHKVPGENNIVIHTGDIGIIWNRADHIGKEEVYLKKWYSNISYKVITCGGNHENWERIFNLPLVYCDWLNGEAYEYIPGKVYYAKRGIVYEIQGKKIFFAGGAFSTDAKFRIEGTSIWKDLEMMSLAEMDAGRESLNNVNNEVDYIVSHAPPTSVSVIMGYFENTIQSNYLEQIRENTEFKEWYFGHLHQDKYITLENKYHCVYREPRIIN